MIENISSNDRSYIAQDLAGKSILLEIGAKAGILQSFENESTVTVSLLQEKLNIQPDFLKTYLDTLTSLDLLTCSSIQGQDHYTKAAAFDEEVNRVGYVAWGMMSCAPLINNTQDFIKDFDSAVRSHHRCGEHVARTSKWMGEKSFYPHAEKVILDLNPKKVIDLGSGTCGLLIRLSEKLKAMQGVGVDISKEACDKAQLRINELSLQNRIDVVLAPIQDLIQDKKDIFRDADVVHAGFVFHDLMPDEEQTLDQLLSTIHHVAPRATVVVVEAIPFCQNVPERAFSSAFSFLHRFFMGRQLQSEEQWTTKLKKAGFTHVSIQSLGISGGRIFVAT